MGPQDPEEEKKEFKPVIPRGWTFLKHGTNLLGWGEINPYTSDEIELEKHMSTVSREQAEFDSRGKKYDTARTYGMVKKPEGMNEEEFTQKNKPFKIRIMFYRDHARHIYNPEYKRGLNKETMDKINKYYYNNIQQGRHPLVPKKEILIKLGQTKEEDRDVFYFVPESVSEVYLKEANIETEEQK